jgi:hypothetical protein
MPDLCFWLPSTWDGIELYLMDACCMQVLAADEFWPAQGGKAPELSQVKDALDAILSSQQYPK